MENRNTNLLGKVNPFIEYDLFKNDCCFSYHLNIVLTRYPLWVLNHINGFYLDEYKISFFNKNKGFINIFSEVLDQRLILDSEFNISNFFHVIDHQGYILCLFDTFYMPFNMNYKKYHNYNSLLVYGYEKEYLFVYASKDKNGACRMKIKFEDFKKILITDFSKVKNRDYLNHVGLPLSYIHIKHTYSTYVCQEEICQTIRNFYNTEMECTNCGVFDYFLKSKIWSLRTESYIEHNNVIFSIKLIIDFYILLNKKIMLTFNNKTLIKNNDEIIKILNILMSKYIKLQFSHYNNNLDNVPIYIKKLINISRENKKIIKEV